MCGVREADLGERLQVHHLDGLEAHADPRNLLLVCRSCNQRADRVLKAHGHGRRTRQYNPPATGAASLGEYVSALRILRGELAGDFDKARATVHNTPAATRSEFATEIWRRRRRSGGAGRDTDLVRMLTGG